MLCGRCDSCAACVATDMAHLVPPGDNSSNQSMRQGVGGILSGGPSGCSGASLGAQQWCLTDGSVCGGWGRAWCVVVHLRAQLLEAWWETLRLFGRTSQTHSWKHVLGGLGVQTISLNIFNHFTCTKGNKIV